MYALIATLLLTGRSERGAARAGSRRHQLPAEHRDVSAARAPAAQAGDVAWVVETYALSALNEAIVVVNPVPTECGDKLDNIAADRKRVEEKLPLLLGALNQAWERYGHLSRARIVDLPESNHHACITNAQEVFEAMSAFLRALANTAARVARPVVDALEYVVRDHGRVAGRMRVAAGADSVIVRYDYGDRYRSRAVTCCI